MRTLFFVISSPISVRNFFLIPQGVLARLKENPHVRVVVLAAEEAYEDVRRDFAEGNIIVEPIRVTKRKNVWQQASDFFSKYLIFTDLMRLNAIMGNRIDVDKRERNTFLFPLKWMLSRTLGRSRWVKRVLSPFLNCLAYRARPYRTLFEKYKPDLVFVAHIFSEQGLEAIRESRRQGVHSLGIPESWDNFQKRFEAIKPHHVLVWHETQYQEALTVQAYNRDEITITGVPQYDMFAHPELLIPRDEFFKHCGLDASKKLVTFFSSTKYSPDDGDIVDMILKSIEKDKLAMPTELFVRPYPGVPFDHQKFDKFEGRDHVYINWTEIRKVWGTASHGWYPQADAFRWLASVIYHTDIMINTYSSVSIEASAFLKPVININFDGYQHRPYEKSVRRFKDHLSHFRHVNETGGVVFVESEKELLDAINGFLTHPDSNKENLIRLQKKLCGPIDGKSGERITKEILSHLAVMSSN